EKGQEGGGGPESAGQEWGQGRSRDRRQTSRQGSHHLHAARAEAQSQRDRQGEADDDERLGHLWEEPPPEQRDGDACDGEGWNEDIPIGPGLCHLRQGGRQVEARTCERGWCAKSVAYLRAQDEERRAGDE